MPTYLSPGVYVEEIPASVQAIAGVGTSTAGFIGLVPESLLIPRPNSQHEPTRDPTEIVDVDVNQASTVGLTLAQEITLLQPYLLPAGSEIDASLAQALKVAGNQLSIRYVQPIAEALLGKTLAAAVIDPGSGTVMQVEIGGAMVALEKGHVIVQGQVGPIRDALAAAGIEQLTTQETVDMVVEEADVLEGKILGASTDIQRLPSGLAVRDEAMARQITQAVQAQGGTTLAVRNSVYLSTRFFPKAAIGEVELCTNFTEFRNKFGGFSTDVGQRNLAHAVSGFFRNGGTRCFVARIAATSGIEGLLEKFAAVNEIALVAAPGINDAGVRDAIVTHCKILTQDRFAIFDSDETITGALTEDNIGPPPNSDYAAFYFPWIQVLDPAAKIQNPNGDGRIFVPPSGHMAGIYARVNTDRGVHKAPANEPVMGALGLKYQISKAQQDGLNPQGINCIRDLNGNIRVWGARTIGGDANGEWRYINVRRTFLFLRESIDEGMQWAVFEPNDEKLWAKITRNVSAFLNTVWRSGALFGSTPDQAFYVKCDAETDPPELREVGQVVTEIGVAVVRPAEFVIFRISQWQAE